MATCGIEVRKRSEMTIDQLLEYMLEEMKNEGIGKRTYARKYGLNYPHLTKIFNRTREPGTAFLKKIGFIKVTSHTYIKQE